MILCGAACRLRLNSASTFSWIELFDSEFDVASSGKAHLSRESDNPTGRRSGGLLKNEEAGKGAKMSGAENWACNWN